MTTGEFIGSRRSDLLLWSLRPPLLTTPARRGRCCQAQQEPGPGLGDRRRPGQMHFLPGWFETELTDGVHGAVPCPDCTNGYSRSSSRPAGWAEAGSVAGTANLAGKRSHRQFTGAASRGRRGLFMVFFGAPVTRRISGTGWEKTFPMPCPTHRGAGTLTFTLKPNSVAMPQTSPF